MGETGRQRVRQVAQLHAVDRGRRNDLLPGCFLFDHLQKVVSVVVPVSGGIEAGVQRLDELLRHLHFTLAWSHGSLRYRHAER